MAHPALIRCPHDVVPWLVCVPDAATVRHRAVCPAGLWRALPYKKKDGCKVRCKGICMGGSKGEKNRWEDVDEAAPTEGEP